MQNISTDNLFLLGIIHLKIHPVLNGHTETFDAYVALKTISPRSTDSEITFKWN